MVSQKPSPRQQRRPPAYILTSPPPSRSVPREHPTPAPAPVVSEPAPACYTTAPAWIDTAGRTRTWNLHDPAGAKMAEIATLRDARKMAALFNCLMGEGKGR